MILYGGGGSSKKRFNDVFVIDLFKEEIRKIESNV